MTTRCANFLILLFFFFIEKKRKKRRKATDIFRRLKCVPFFNTPLFQNIFRNFSIIRPFFFQIDPPPPHPPCFSSFHVYTAQRDPVSVYETQISPQIITGRPSLFSTPPSHFLKTRFERLLGPRSNLLTNDIVSKYFK